MSMLKIERAIETVDDLFESFRLPSDIPRMTYHDTCSIGIPFEVVERLRLDPHDDYPVTVERDRNIALALLTRLYTLEDQIERGDLAPVKRGTWVDEGGIREYHCSLCGCEAPNDAYDCGAEYCSECGAEMRCDSE